MGFLYFYLLLSDKPWPNRSFHHRRLNSISFGAPAMPGLLTSNHELPNSTNHKLPPEDHFTSASSKKPTKPLPAAAMAKTVELFPSMMDAPASTTTEVDRMDPFRLLMQDFLTLLSMLQYAPWRILLFQTLDPNAKLYHSWRGIRDMALQSWLFLFELGILMFTVPAFLVFPGAMFIGLAIFCCCAIYIAAWPMCGSKVAYSYMDEETTVKANLHESERWMFVNGCITGSSTFPPAFLAFYH